MVNMITATTIEYFLEILSAIHLNFAGSAFSSRLRGEA